MTPIRADELLALAVAISFAAGLNIYAVLLTLGLLAQADVVTLPASIALIGNWWVIGISGALFVLEFFADKIPGFDLVWQALQTLVRVPAGALLAFAATEPLSTLVQAGATVGGGAIAFTAHGGKLALRSAATASPEPFSNVILSLVEDTIAIALTWFATSYPLLAAAIALGFVVALALVLRWIVRTVRRVFRDASRQLTGAGGGAAPG